MAKLLKESELKKLQSEFEKALTKPSKETEDFQAIRTMWKSNKELRDLCCGMAVTVQTDQGQRQVSFSPNETISTFLSILKCSQGQVKTLLDIWESSKTLRDLFCGRAVVHQTDQGPQNFSLSSKKLISYFILVMKSRYQMVMNSIWDSNQALQLAIKNSPNKELQQKVLRVALWSAKSGISEFMIKYVGSIDDVEFLKNAREVLFKIPYSQMSLCEKNRLNVLNERITFLEKNLLSEEGVNNQLTSETLNSTGSKSANNKRKRFSLGLEKTEMEGKKRKTLGFQGNDRGFSYNNNEEVGSNYNTSDFNPYYQNNSFEFPNTYHFSSGYVGVPYVKEHNPYSFNKDQLPLTEIDLSNSILNGFYGKPNLNLNHENNSFNYCSFNNCLLNEPSLTEIDLSNSILNDFYENPNSNSNECNTSLNPRSHLLNEGFFTKDRTSSDKKEQPNDNLINQNLPKSSYSDTSLMSQFTSIFGDDSREEKDEEKYNMEFNFFD